MSEAKRYYYSEQKPKQKKSSRQLLQLVKNVKKSLQQKIQTSNNRQNYIEHIISLQKPRQLKSTFSIAKQKTNDLYEYSSHLQRNRGFLQQASKIPENEQVTEFEGLTIPGIQKPELIIKKFGFIKKIGKMKQALPLSSVSQWQINRPQIMQLKLSQSDRIMQILQQPKFQYYFTKIPQRRERRHNSHLEPALKYLKENNKFFKNLDEHLAMCLLTIGEIGQLKAGELLYCVGFDRKFIYIILEGAINLTNSHTCMKKIYVTGETLGEEMLFTNCLDKKLLQTAKAVTKTYILQIKVSQFYEICNETKMYGYSPEIALLQEKFRKGFISKNLQRHQYIIERKKKWMSHNSIHLFK